MKNFDSVEINIKWPAIVNERFLPLLGNRDRYLLLWGGRGSGKSVFAAQVLLLRCLGEEYFKYILIKKTFNSIKDAQWETLKQTAQEMKIDEYFEFKTSPLEIVCRLNGNKFIARGCDDTAKLKSIKDPTGAWYEETIPTEEDFITITTSIRTVKANFLQEIFTFNPEVEGDYAEHWFYKRFFAGHDEPDFTSKISAVVDRKEVGYSYTSHHSTAEDNRFLPVQFRAFLQSLKESNPYYYTIYALGQWGMMDNANPWLYSFDETKHVRPLAFMPSFPVYLSFDFNTDPLSCIAMQHSVQQGGANSFVHIIKEFGGYMKLEDICQQIRTAFPASILYVTGDRSGQNEDVGRNQTIYGMIQSSLHLSDKQMNLNSYNLEHADSRLLCNTMFYHYNNLYIDPSCKNLIADCKKARPDLNNAKPSHLLKDRGIYKMDYFDAMRYYFQTYWNKFVQRTYLVND